MFLCIKCTVTKSSAPFLVSYSIELVTEIEYAVFCIRKFSCVTITNHSGNLNSCHYMCMVKDEETWWNCDDKAMITVNMDDISKLPYVLLYQVHNVFCDFCFSLQGMLTKHSKGV